jgi:CheY-like chemotaxis protein
MKEQGMVAKAGASVMVVEDQAVIATWLQLRLERLGYTVLDSASDAEDAVTKARTLNPEVILMDVHLGGGSDGVLAAQQIREQYGIPVVLVTGSVDEHTLRRAREASLDGFIQKPFDERQLHTAIQTALCKRRLEVEHNPASDTTKQAPPVEWPLRAMLHRLNNELAVATALLDMLQEDQEFPAATQQQMRKVQERLASAGQLTAQVQRAAKAVVRPEPGAAPTLSPSGSSVVDEAVAVADATDAVAHWVGVR